MMTTTTQTQYFTAQAAHPAPVALITRRGARRTRRANRAI